MTDPFLKPGDKVRCSDCGETVTAVALGDWRPGGAVHLPFTGGPSPRAVVTHYPIDRCQWCHERHMAIGDRHLHTLAEFIGHAIPNPYVKQEIRMSVPQDAIEIAARSLEPAPSVPVLAVGDSHFGDGSPPPNVIELMKSPGVMLEVGDLVAINGNGEARPAGPAKLRVVGPEPPWSKERERMERDFKREKMKRKKKDDPQGSLF